MATDLTDLIVNLGTSIGTTARKSLDLSTPESKVSQAKNFSTTFGTGLGKADQLFHDRRIVAASTSDDLDLAGVLTNAFGGTITFASIKAIVLYNRSDETWGAHSVATDATIAVGGAAANEFQGPMEAAGDAIVVPAGGLFVITKPETAGWPVTADTGDILRIENLDGTDEAMYDIFLIGESA